MDTVQNVNEVNEVEQVSSTLTDADLSPAETGKPLSEREFKIAMQKALKDRKEKIKQNKEMLAEMQLEVDYWKAQSDLLKYRYEKMDYYLRNLDLEPKYLQAVEAQKALDETPQTPILD